MYMIMSTFNRTPRRRVQPNTFAYNAAINACAKGKMWPEALALLRTMKQERVEINTATFNALMDA